MYCIPCGQDDAEDHGESAEEEELDGLPDSEMEEPADFPSLAPPEDIVVPPAVHAVSDGEEIPPTQVSEDEGGNLSRHQRNLQRLKRLDELKSHIEETQKIIESLT